MKELNIRRGRQRDLRDLQEIFLDTITTVCSVDYQPEQIKAWTSGVEDMERWCDIITNQNVLVAEKMKEIVGFSSIRDENHIDLLYVRRDHQRQGIAKQLYEIMERSARLNHQIQLTSDVSKTALPFFEKMGFTVLNKQVVLRQRVTITNYKMEKVLMWPARM